MTRVGACKVVSGCHGPIRIGASVGIVGGLAEVVWISLYANLVGGSAVEVANGITATVAPAFAGSAAALPVGLSVHFGLAALLGVAVTVLLRVLFLENAGAFRGLALVVLALAGIWALNFLIILPAINPEFVTLVPLWASFTSKMLFGLSAAVALSATLPGAGPRER